MADEFEATPPPYDPDDSLRTPIPTRSDTVHQNNALRLNTDSRGIPSYEHAVGQDWALLFKSAIQYFDEHPPPHRQLQDGLTQHTLCLTAQSEATDVSFVPLCWQVASANVTQNDIATFANYLFPVQSISQTSVHDRYFVLEAEVSEPWFQRKHRFKIMVAEWNEGFFGPRGLHLNLILEYDDRRSSPSTDVHCAGCIAASYGGKGRSVPQSKEVTEATNNLATQAWRPLSVAVGLTLKALSHHVEQRARCTGGCDSRQNLGCRSRRRRCGQKTSESAAPITLSVEAEKSAGTPWLSESSPPKPPTGSSSKHLKPHDLSTLSASMGDMGFTNRSKTTTVEDLQNKPPAAPDTTLQDIKSDLATLLTFPTPLPFALNKPERVALKSQLKTLKHSVKAAARQARAERREDARSNGRRHCGRVTCQEKRELRTWKRACIGEIREVDRKVRRAGRG